MCRRPWYKRDKGACAEREWIVTTIDPTMHGWKESTLSYYVLCCRSRLLESQAGPRVASYVKAHHIMRGSEMDPEWSTWKMWEEAAHRPKRASEGKPSGSTAVQARLGPEA